VAWAPIVERHTTLAGRVASSAWRTARIDGPGFRKTGLRIEDRRRRMKTARDVRECTGERLGILHFGERDFAAQIGPDPAFVRIANDGADRLTYR